MALQPLRIIKNWFTNTFTREKNWDEIADNLVSYAGRTNNNLKQIGLDIDGATYEFNNNGRATQTRAIVDRIDSLEAVEYAFGARNLGLDLSVTGVITLVGADGNALSATNIGIVAFNSTASAGVVKSYELTSNLSVTLTGAHWGKGGGGDLSDVVLWPILIDTGSAVILGVLFKAGRQTVTTADDETVATSVTTEDKVLVSSALSAENNCVYLGWLRANFDDTGNAGGEDFWTVQTGVGDVNIGRGEPSVSDLYVGRDLYVNDDLNVTDDCYVGGTTTVVDMVLVGSMDVLDVTGATTLNGAVTLGDAGADVVTVTGTAGFTETITCVAIDASGSIDTDSTVSGARFIPDADGTVANSLYKANIPKAWASFTIDAASPGVVDNGHNIAGITWSGDDATVEIDTDMADVNYAISAQMLAYGVPAEDRFCVVDNLVTAVGTFTVIQYDASVGGPVGWSDGNRFSVIVMGDQ